MTPGDRAVYRSHRRAALWYLRARRARRGKMTQDGLYWFERYASDHICLARRAWLKPGTVLTAYVPWTAEV